MNQPLVKRSRKLLFSKREPTFLRFDLQSPTNTIKATYNLSNLVQGRKDAKLGRQIASLLLLFAAWRANRKLNCWIGKTPPDVLYYDPELWQEKKLSQQQDSSCSCRLQVPSSTNTLSSDLFVDDDYFAREFSCKMTLPSGKLPLPCRDTAVL